MIAETGKTQIKLTFPFAATICFMLYLCDEKTVLFTLLSSFFHESGHLIAMKLFEVEIHCINFGAFGIRIDRPNLSIVSYKREAFIAVSGILFNIIAIIFSACLNLLLKNATALHFAAVNLLIVVVNSLPARYTDTGRALHFLLLSYLNESAAERIVTLVSLITAIIVGLFSFLYNIFISFNISLTVVTIYLIILTFKRKDEK